MIPRAGFALLLSMPIAAVTRPAVDRAERAFRDAGMALGGTVSAFVGGASEPVPLVPSEPEPVSGVLAEAAVPEGPAPDPKPAKRTSKSNKNGRHPPRAPELVVSIGEQTILELARLRAVPEGRPVPPKGRRPAGIELYGVGRLGVGLRDGDVLTAVEGRSVQAEGQVIGAVTGVLMRQGRRISGEFWRGERRGVIVVDLPIVRLSP